MSLRTFTLVALSVPALVAQTSPEFLTRTDLPFRLPKPTKWQMPRPLCNIIMDIQPYLYEKRGHEYTLSPDFIEFRDTYKNIYEDRDELMLWVEFLLKDIIDTPALIKTRRNQCLPMLDYVRGLKKESLKP
jgi:hypothetical protein